MFVNTVSHLFENSRRILYSKQIAKFQSAEI